MKLQIKTDVLQELVGRAVKGAGNNKLIPITELMAITVSGGELELITTDATNYLYVKNRNFTGDDFYIVIPVDMFSRLVSKMTCENITLEVLDNSLKITGNGEYFIELPLDEDGQLIQYPNPLTKLDMSNTDKVTLHYSTIQAILNSIRPSLMTTLDIPCYTGYYMADKVVATDTYKIAAMMVPIFNKPMLLSSEVMDLLSVMTTEHIEISVLDSVIVFSSSDCVVYGTIMEGVDEYAIDDIMELVNTDFDSSCKIAKALLLQVLDRLSLFVTTYDKSGIYLTFTSEGLQISSKSSTGIEIIPYIESKNFKPFTCCIDIEMLMSQIKAQVSDAIEMHYGLDNAIKMVDGNTIQITALLEDDRLE